MGVAACLEHSSGHFDSFIRFIFLCADSHPLSQLRSTSWVRQFPLLALWETLVYEKEQGPGWPGFWLPESTVRGSGADGCPSTAAEPRALWSCRGRRVACCPPASTLAISAPLLHPKGENQISAWDLGSGCPQPKRSPHQLIWVKGQSPKTSSLTPYPSSPGPPERSCSFISAGCIRY